MQGADRHLLHPNPTPDGTNPFVRIATPIKQVGVDREYPPVTQAPQGRYGARPA